MRKPSKFLVATMIAALALGLVAGCGTSGTSGTANQAPAKKIKIGFSLPTLKEARYPIDKDSFVKAAQDLGAEILVQTANNDETLQKSQVEDLITQGINVLVLDPQNAVSAADLVNEAHNAKIKVISYDRLIMNADVDAYVSFDNEKVGELQGEYITKQVAKGNYFVFAGAPTDNNATLFKKGAMKFIQPLVDKGDIKVLFDQPVPDWDPAKAMTMAENALTANKNNVNAILAPNDGTAGGIIQALAEQKLAGKVVVTGQDSELAGIKRIVAGTQSMTVFKDVRTEAQETAKLAVEMAKGQAPTLNSKVNNQKIDVPSLLLTPIVVTKDNIDKVLVDSGWFTKAQVYGN